MTNDTDQDKFSHMTNLTQADFNNLKTSESIYLIDFWAEWCGPCKAMNPVLERLSADKDLVEAKINFAKVDTESEQDLTVQFGIRGIPCFKLLHFDGKGDYKVLGEFIGVQSDPLKFKTQILDLAKKAEVAA